MSDRTAIDHASPGASRLSDGEGFQERLANRQLALLPSLTHNGFAKVRTPDVLQRELGHWFDEHRGEAEAETKYGSMFHPPGNRILPERIPVSDGLTELALSQMQPLLVRWCGHRLEPSRAYGLRVYRRGNVLYRHVDIVETHVISASLLVSQDVDEPWPLVLETWDGKRHELVLGPGEALLYEGAKLPHFRDSPLQGQYYAALFVHFRPLWWRYTSNRIEKALACLPPRYPRRSLRYGRASGALEKYTSGSSAARAKKEGKYLAFETDLGGWNNILMQFEIMVMIAWLTDRTLILPPATPFYLLGEEARLLEDFLDLGALRSLIPVLTAEEFVTASGLEPPVARHDEFHSHMRAHGHSPGWNGLKDGLAYPADAMQLRPELAERVLERRIVEYGGEAQSCDLLYFPMDLEHRMFGVAEAFLLLGDPKLERAGRTLLREGIRFREDLVALAERALESPALAGGSFAALHVRRGDFQYEKTQINAAEILQHIRALLQPGQTLYLATDEPERAFFDVLREEFHLVTFGCLLEEVTTNTPHHWRGIVETLICAGAPGPFVATRLSTFSARIQLLRGHLSHTRGGDCEDIDTALYYTQPPLRASTAAQARPYGPPSKKHFDEFGETVAPWWRSVRAVPVWGRAYRDVWAETQD